LNGSGVLLQINIVQVRWLTISPPALANLKRWTWCPEAISTAIEVPSVDEPSGAIYVPPRRRRRTPGLIYERQQRAGE
jgi:hypothetical protein